MNLYEHTIIARQDTSPSELKQLTEKYSKIVEKNDGEVVKTENWGLLNLSYLIKKNKKGSYIHFKIKAKFLALLIERDSSLCFFCETLVILEGKIFPFSDIYFFNNLIFL